MTKKTKLGATGPEVFPMALGCMGLGEQGAYGNSDDTESIATVQMAIERGVNLIDTGDFYSMGRNEMLVGKALKGRRDKALLSVKFGGMRGPDGQFVGFDTRPNAIKNFLSYSLARLGVDYIDIYRPARLDPSVPIEDTVGAIADLVKAGYVRHIALSEVGADTIERAVKVHPIVDLQIEYALISRGPEAKIFPVLSKHAIAVTAYGVLSRGLLTGSKATGPGDFRAHSPRFQGENMQKNGKLVEELEKFAASKKLTPAQVAIAYVRAKGAALNVTVIPTIGSRNRAQLESALSALDVSLTPADVATLEAAVPASEVAGSRYVQAQMQMLDSEK
ncbi:MAG TPA: aldo/keto reductase [Kofleriaceae bacterium]|jgi:aryl-alcohol dehydrogenase-like predicted oxidoreductase